MAWLNSRRGPLVRTAKCAEQIGVDGLMVLPGMVYNSDPRETVQHFRSVAAATTLPIMCYNNPPVYRVDITPEMFQQLSDVENIVCIKEASGDVRRITDLFNCLGDRYLIFSGLDDVALESILLGCTGWISGLVDAFPRENRLLWDAATDGDYARALEIYRWYMPLLHFDSHPEVGAVHQADMQRTRLRHRNGPRPPGCHWWEKNASES